MMILLIEDDQMIGESIVTALEYEGYPCHWANSGDQAEQLLQTQRHDLILLDLGLPQKDGFELLRGLRARRDATPVLVITARDNVQQRVLGLNSGADDYLGKPFDLDELLARIRALLRRAGGQRENSYRTTTLYLHAGRREALVNGETVILSAREWSIIEALIAWPGAIVSKAQLEQHLYGGLPDVESNTIEVYIHGIRKKLGPDLIQNVRGLGYMVAKCP